MAVTWTLFLVVILQVVFYHKTLGQASGSGICSWYGAPNEIPEGYPTACPGQGFSRFAMATAHPTLPCGTVIQVTNLENKTFKGRKVTVTVNDRGPFIPGRILDLTYAAFQAFDNVDDGIIDCSYTVQSDEVVEHNLL